MEAAVKILTSDAMIIVYEVIMILIFGGLNLFLGKKRRMARLEEEREAIQKQEEKLQESLENIRRR